MQGLRFRIWGIVFSKIKATLLGAPFIRTIVFLVPPVGEREQEKKMEATKSCFCDSHGTEAVCALLSSHGS